MKTTLNIDDELLRLAKRSALDRGITLTQVIEEALAAAVLHPGQPSEFRLRWRPVRGRQAPPFDIADRQSLYDRMEDRL